MCHEYTARDWTRETEEPTEDDEEELPGFLNNEGEETVEMVTDGGDET
jgi:hypothetical protein